MANETVQKRERKTDPDITRIKDVKEAVEKRDAAKVAVAKAQDRQTKAQMDLEKLISGAPDAQRSYLMSLAGITTG